MKDKLPSIFTCKNLYLKAESDILRLVQKQVQNHS